VLITEFTPYLEGIPAARIPALDQIGFPGSQDMPIPHLDDPDWRRRIHGQIPVRRPPTDLEFPRNRGDLQPFGPHGLDVSIADPHPDRFVSLPLARSSGHTGPIKRRDGLPGAAWRGSLGIEAVGCRFEVQRLVQKEVLDRIAEIHEHMPPIGDLPHLGGTQPNSFNIVAPAIAADDFNGWVRVQPRSNRRWFSIRQEIDRLLPLHIDAHRSIPPAFFPGPIVQPNDSWCGGYWRLIGMEQPELGAWAGREGKGLAEARTAQPTDGKREGLPGRSEAVGSSGIALNRREPFAKNAPGAAWLVTKQAPNSEPEDELVLEHGQISNRAEIRTVHTVTADSTPRTGGEWGDRPSG
jgi:hypothetical protein